MHGEPSVGGDDLLWSILGKMVDEGEGDSIDGLDLNLDPIDALIGAPLSPDEYRSPEGSGGDSGGNIVPTSELEPRALGIEDESAFPMPVDGLNDWDDGNNGARVNGNPGTSVTPPGPHLFQQQQQQQQNFSTTSHQQYQQPQTKDLTWTTYTPGGSPTVASAGSPQQAAKVTAIPASSSASTGSSTSSKSSVSASTASPTVAAAAAPPKGKKMTTASASATTSSAASTTSSAPSTSSSSSSSSSQAGPVDEATRRAQITERNRIAQQQSRARKKKELEDLRQWLGDTESQLKDARDENQRLKDSNAELQREVERLRALALNPAAAKAGADCCDIGADLSAGDLARQEVAAVQSLGLPSDPSNTVPPPDVMLYGSCDAQSNGVGGMNGDPFATAVVKGKRTRDGPDDHHAVHGPVHGKLEEFIVLLKDADAKLKGGEDMSAPASQLVAKLQELCPLMGQTNCGEMAKACINRVRTAFSPDETSSTPEDASACKAAWYAFVNEELGLTDTHRRAIMAHRDEIMRRLDRIFAERHRLSRELMEALKEQRRVTVAGAETANSIKKEKGEEGGSALAVVVRDDNCAQRSAGDRVQSELSRMQVNISHEREARHKFFQAMIGTLTPEQVTRIFLKSAPNPPSFLSIANIVNAAEEDLRKNAAEAVVSQKVYSH